MQYLVSFARTNKENAFSDESDAFFCLWSDDSFQAQYLQRRRLEFENIDQLIRKNYKIVKKVSIIYFLLLNLAIL